MNYVFEDLTKTLRVAREEKGLSQRALSQKTGMPRRRFRKSKTPLST